METPESTDDRPLEAIVSGAVFALTFIVGFGLMFAGQPYFWVAFPVGFAGVLPIALGLVRRYERDRESTDGRRMTGETEDALEQLRWRYARGELTDDEFERRVERLLETESVQDAQTFVDRARAGQRRRETAGARERDLE